jgi:hypothetical protein
LRKFLDVVIDLPFNDAGGVVLQTEKSDDGQKNQRKQGHRGDDK